MAAPSNANLHIPLIRVLLTIFVTCEIHGFAMMKAIQVVYRIFLLSSNNVIIQTTAKAGLTQMVTTMFSKLSRVNNGSQGSGKSKISISHTAASNNDSLSANSASSSSPSFDAFLAYKRDCQVLFRYLCQVTSRPELDQSPAVVTPQVALQGRILAYELILSALNQSGPVIRNDMIFLHLIKKDLFLSLSKTGVSVNPALFELTLSVFLMLLNLFHAQIKTEVEVLFNEIYLKILESPNATFQQKNKVLQSILKITGNPQYLVDIYVNYDCDFAMESIYERIVLDLCKMSQGRNGVSLNNKDSSAIAAAEEMESRGLLGFGNVSPDQLSLLEGKIRVKSLRCIIAMVNSLLRWSTETAPSIGMEAKESLQPTVIASTQSAEEGDSNVVSPTSFYETPETSPNLVDETASTSGSFDSNSHGSAIIMPKSPLNIISIGVNSSSPKTFQSAVDPAKLEETKLKKKALKEGLALFNSKPKAGIRYLVEQGIIKAAIPNKIVDFILQSLTSINKAALGEYFGESDELGVKVMHAFVDRLDFSGIPFVTSLRSFLQYFRLPGEAQKIDRIMEKFAARYFETNPDIFANADAAYTLAFSVIMLNTDLHSPSIKKRMEKHEFLRNNRGINDNSDLPDDFLGVIYDEINTNEIVLEDERVRKGAAAAAAGTSHEIYEKETAQMKAKSEARFKGPRPPAAAFRSAMHAEHVKSMFELIWAPLLAALSRMYEEAPQPAKGDMEVVASLEATEDISQICLGGLLTAIQISCLFNLELPRDAFVGTLAKFTLLTTAAGPSTLITRKSISAFKALLSIAKTNGNDLDSNWIIVLQCITKVDSNAAAAALNAANGTSSGPERGIFAFVNYLKTSGSGSSPGTGSNAGATGPSLSDSSTVNPSLKLMQSEFQNQEMLVSIDRIFSDSVHLNGTAILHFFRALCQVSQEEIDATSSGSESSISLFCLQRIVEIAYYNLSRIRLEWSQIWKVGGI